MPIKSKKKQRKANGQRPLAAARCYATCRMKTTIAIVAASERPANRRFAAVSLLACALHDSRQALGRAFAAAQDAGLDKTATEIALTLADVSAAADKTDAFMAQANDPDQLSGDSNQKPK